MNTPKRDPLENFEAQFKKSTLPLMVLTILSEREKMYAYEITKEALERSSGRYKMPLLYTTLNKLQEQGFVAEVEKIITDANRVRIYYCITETGRRYLSELKTLYKELSDTVRSIVLDEKS